MYMSDPLRFLVLNEIDAERDAQEIKFPNQHLGLPDGTGKPGDAVNANYARAECQQAFDNGDGTWRHILEEEVRELYAETDPARLLAEAIQVSAVAAAWAEELHRRMYQ